jgi:hypothetical protein
MNRELDAVVAEKVMRLYDVHKAGNGEWVYRDEKGFLTKLPHYSTDIAAAWQVVEKMRMMWGEVALRTDGYRWEFDGYRWGFGWEGDEGIWGHATADTAPEAICFAALEAICLGEGGRA